MKQHAHTVRKLLQTAIAVSLIAFGMYEIVGIASGQESATPLLFMPQIVQKSGSVRPTDDGGSATSTSTATSVHTPDNATATATVTATPTHTPVTATATATAVNTAVPATATATPIDTPANATATATPVETPPGATVTPGVFMDAFDGDPSRPTPFRSAVWDVTVHSRSMANLYTLQGMDAQHAPNCDPPPATHTISAYEDAVYTCRNHMMTAINDSAYGLIYLTPAYQVDFTDGTATIRFDLSTQRTSLRDWVDLYISPMEDHLQLALIDWLPDLGGEPKRAMHIRMDSFDGRTNFNVSVIDNHSAESVDSLWWVGYEEYLEPSAKVRSTFELQISRTHVKFGMPDHNLWWVDSDIDPLDWSVGVVQFGHHSYTPEKDCALPNGCGPNTWHWDNISIEPARPFTMIHAAQRYVDPSNGPEVSFEAPAPENAFLRFAGIGNNLEVSFDGGSTWQSAQVQEQEKYTEEAFWSYFTPIPAGTDRVQFRGEHFWGGDWHVRDLSIWANR